MNTSAFADKDYNLWVLLSQTRDVIFKVRENELSQYGITAVEATALFVIRVIGDEATPAKISRCMLRQHHTVTALLKRMENKGLIMRTKDPDRKNTWRVCLTEKGQNAYNQSSIRDSLHAVMSIFSENEHEQLEKYLKKLRDEAIKHIISVPVLPFP